MKKCRERKTLNGDGVNTKIITGCLNRQNGKNGGVASIVKMDANTQIQRKAADQQQIIAGESLPVMEAFYTLQGEGAFQGRAAYFIRLGGCDVGCVWCDVKESWDARAHPLKTVQTILSEALEEIARNESPKIADVIAVITGGEPLMYELGPLSKALHEAGFRVHVETSGAYPLSGELDWICVSPKKFKAPLREVLNQAQELKVVVYNRSDFKWGEEHASQVSKNCRLFLQPEWSKEKQMLPLMIDYVKSHPRWGLCVQVHKYINVP